MKTVQALKYCFLILRCENGWNRIIGKKLRERSYQTLIIYVSGYDQYMRQLFEAEPFRFLSKPLKQEELENVLDKAFERISRFHRELFTIRFGKTW